MLIVVWRSSIVASFVRNNPAKKRANCFGSTYRNCIHASQLIQSEKWIRVKTAGIAHEIQNTLNLSIISSVEKCWRAKQAIEKETQRVKQSWWYIRMKKITLRNALSDSKGIAHSRTAAVRKNQRYQCPVENTPVELHGCGRRTNP